MTLKTTAPVAGRCVRRPSPGAKWVLGSLALGLSSAAALAANCDATGGLRFLGTTADQSRSVWLSGTSAGSFALEAAQGNQTVDQWTKQRAGLRVTLSPVVSNGNGGVHRLFDASGGRSCLLDTQNQRGGITFPPNIQLPPTIPPITKPPIGITPELPIGVVPPIAILPPIGITPEIPIGVQPPIAILPPTGVTPEVPAARAPAPGTSAVGAGTARATPPTPCPDPERDPAAAALRPECPQPRQHAAAEAFGGQAPVTPGREFAEEPLWNVWADGRYYGSSDRRFGLDLDGRSGYLSVGADRRLNPGLVAGLVFSIEDNRTDGFGDAWRIDSNGFNVGPYIGYRLSPEWSVDASLGYGWLDNDNRISVLSGEYSTQRYSGAVNFTGQYALDEFRLRPKVSAYYSYFDNDGYDLAGNVAGIPVALTVEPDSFDYGVVEALGEVSRAFPISGGGTFVPYVEVGVRYEFEQPNSGQVITGTLSLAEASPWSGSMRVGARTLVSRSMFVEVSAGYLSFGQNGLDLWEGRLYLSYAF